MVVSYTPLYVYIYIVRACVCVYMCVYVCVRVCVVHVATLLYGNIPLDSVEYELL